MPNSQRLTWNQVTAEEREALERAGSSLEHGLVGLALSGGGVRSATFALGVLQGLKAQGVLKKVHYLSTVSGGSYIGGWLSASCHRHTGWLDPNADWAQAIRHLRRHSAHVSPRLGFFSADSWSMVVEWLRTAGVIQTVVVLTLACLLILPRILLDVFVHWPTTGAWSWLAVVLFLLAVTGIAGNQMRLASQAARPILQARTWRIGLSLSVVCGALAWSYAAYRDFDPFPSSPLDITTALSIAVLVLAGAFSLQPVALRLGAFLRDGRYGSEVNYTQAWVQLAVIVPLIAVAYLVTAVMWRQVGGASELARFDNFSGAFTSAWRYWPLPVLVIFVSFWMLSLCCSVNRQPATLIRLLVAPALATPVFHGLLVGVLLMFRLWAHTRGGEWNALIWGAPMIVVALVLAILTVLGIIGSRSDDGASEWFGRLVAWLVIYATAWVAIAVMAVYGPDILRAALRWAVSKYEWTIVIAVGGWVVRAMLGAAGTRSSGRLPSLFEKAQDMAVTATRVAVTVAAFMAVALTLASVVDFVLPIDAPQLSWLGLPAAAPNNADSAPTAVGVLLAFASAALALAAMVDINELGQTSFFRSRLVRCYLGGTRSVRNPQNFTGYDPSDDLPLADLVTPVVSGPLHIINCAMNLGTASDLNVVARSTTVFSLSPLHCGTAYTALTEDGHRQELGYVPTSLFAGGPSMGRAIRASGVTTNPMHSVGLSPTSAFLLSLISLRSGWWVPNPGRPEAANRSLVFGIRYLVSELFGRVGWRSPFLMLSDGGIFDNLAAYELVRRRCRVVVISDATWDPRYVFEGVGRLIRRCEIDFGCRITLSVEDIRPGRPGKFSSKRWAVGRINYGDGSDGILVFIKASMCGTEDTSVLQYKASHPSFPHEPGFGRLDEESQFESYRRLGEEIASELFAAGIPETPMHA